MSPFIGAYLGVVAVIGLVGWIGYPATAAIGFGLAGLHYVLPWALARVDELRTSRRYRREFRAAVERHPAGKGLWLERNEDER